MPRPKKLLPNRKDGLYEVKITLGKRLDGSLIRKSFYSSKSKSDAQKQAEQFQIDLAVAERTGEAFITKNQSFAAWAEHWLSSYKLGKVKGNTFLGTYQNPIEKHLIPYFGATALSDIHPADIQDFFNEKGRTYSLETLKKFRMCLHKIFETAVENELCRKNPVTKSITLVSQKQSAVKKVFTLEQYQKIDRFAVEQHAIDILVLLRTGISRSELLGLRWEDFDEKESVLYIRHGLVQYKDPMTEQWTLDAKGLKNEYRSRPIPIDAELSELLRLKPHFVGLGRAGTSFYREVPTDFIFPSASGGPISPTNWSKRRYAPFMNLFLSENPDIPFLTPHELRHTRATLWKDAGIDLFSIAKLMGHADLNMLSKRYAHNTIDSLKRALGL